MHTLRGWLARAVGVVAVGLSVGLGGVIVDTALAQSDTLKKDEMKKDGMMKQDDMQKEEMKQDDKMMKNDMQKGRMMKDDKMKKDDAMMEKKP